MPTCRDVITRAFRKTKVYGTGEEPSSEDMTDGLDELQSFYEQCAANGMFGQLHDVLTSLDYEAAAGERVTATDGAVITRPTELPDDETKPPYELSFIEVVDTVAQTVTRYLYENGAWVDINSLALDDEAPLSGRGRDGLAACLALPLAEEYGGEIGPAVVRQAGSFKTGLSLKFGSDSPRTAPDYF